jgi:hypothetical protein
VKLSMKRTLAVIITVQSLAISAFAQIKPDILAVTGVEDLASLPKAKATRRMMMPETPLSQVQEMSARGISRTETTCYLKLSVTGSVDQILCRNPDFPKIAIHMERWLNRFSYEPLLDEAKQPVAGWAKMAVTVTESMEEPVAK